ncbi:MAG: hypothetical protein IPJ88_12085 [Myxococcales bacterium]|nr:MAG: hypothetical protein IPJ88_12085 [Myxococcales bacterium]
MQEAVVFESAAEEIPMYVYADENAKLRMAAAAIKEEIDPPPFGTATVLRLHSPRILIQQAQAVASALNWHGILMIEFIRDQKDGQWKVIEINGRPWLFFDFFRRAGLDFAHLLVKDLNGGLPEPDAIQTPRSFSLEPGYVHVDLGYAMKRAFDGNPADIETLRTWLQTITGSLSKNFYEGQDEGPAQLEWEELGKRWGLKPEAIGELVLEHCASY